MEQGWDPEVRRFFKKIINSLSFGLLWMMSMATAGIYFKLGTTESSPLYAVILFYTGAVISLFFLLRYYYRMWKD
jgi:membrane protein YdbS with pleckstrin-like domain